VSNRKGAASLGIEPNVVISASARTEKASALSPRNLSLNTSAKADLLVSD